MNKEIEEVAFTEEERELYRAIWEGLGIQDYWDECIWKKARVENCSLALIRKGYRKQKVGRWHYDEENECFVCDCGCSALNNYRGLSVNSKFCPNCGAKMEGESDER